MKKDRLISERRAVEEMKRIGADPAGIRIMKDKSVFRLLMIINIKPALANIIKEDMLSAGGEAAIHKLCCACKVESTDILLMGTIKQYKHLLEKLRRQPYGSMAVCGRIEKILKIMKEGLGGKSP